MRSKSVALALLIHAALIASLAIQHGRKVTLQEVVYSVQMLNIPALPPGPISRATAPEVPDRTTAATAAPGRTIPARTPAPRTTPQFSGDEFAGSLNRKLAGVRTPTTDARTSDPTTRVARPASSVPRLEITPAAGTPSRPLSGGGASPSGAIPGWYLDLLKSRVRENWRVEKRITVLSADISFRLFRDGRVESVVVEKSSGDVRFDAAVVEAVRRTRDIPAFPDTIKENFLDIVIEFSTEG